MTDLDLRRFLPKSGTRRRVTLREAYDDEYRSVPSRWARFRGRILDGVDRSR